MMIPRNGAVTSSDEVLSELATWAFALEGIVQQPSRASLPGARALTVAPGLPANAAAMIVGREFAHVHPQPNGGSLHSDCLPRRQVRSSARAGVNITRLLSTARFLGW